MERGLAVNGVFGHSRLACEHRSLIMERIMQQTQVNAGRSGAGRKRVEAVVETLASLGCEGESVAEVAHDARNMVTALGLYCDPVSYTHLDVYKRQVHLERVRGVALAIRPDRLIADSGVGVEVR